MPAGRDIIDALECVVSVFFSNARHNTRAAFLLCDELVEVTCKAKLRTANPNLGRIGFYGLLSHNDVGLNPAAGGLGQTLFQSHETRNQMQHAVAAATVDEQHCCDAILDAVAAIEHCFPGTAATYSDAMRVAIRVIRVYSSQGTHRQRADFDDEMRRYSWNVPLRRANRMMVPIAVGARPNWGLVVMSNNVTMTTILDRIGAQ